MDPLKKAYVSSILLFIILIDICSISLSSWFQQDFSEENTYGQGGLLRCNGCIYTYVYAYNNCDNSEFGKGFCEQFLFWLAGGIFYLICALVAICLYIGSYALLAKSGIKNSIEKPAKVRAFVIIGSVIKLTAFIVWASLVMLSPTRSNHGYFGDSRKSVWPKEGSIVAMISISLSTLYSIYLYFSS